MRSIQPASFAVRVLVADNNVIQTELLAQAIAKDRDIRVVELSTSCAEVLRGVKNAEPDVLLISETLDQRAGGGLEVVREMRTTRPELKSIVLLDTSEKENVVQAFHAGARGVFCRNHPVKMLCKCIVAVSEGQIWANSSELTFLIEAIGTAPSLCYTTAENLSSLSDRERDVVNCLAEGLSNRDIATRLKISQHTVKNYMFRIFEKLGVSSRLELLFYVMSQASQRHAQINEVVRSLADQPKAALGSHEASKITSINGESAPSRKVKAAQVSSPQLASNLGSA